MNVKINAGILEKYFVHLLFPILHLCPLLKRKRKKHAKKTKTINELIKTDNKETK